MKAPHEVVRERSPVDQTPEHTQRGVSFLGDRRGAQSDQAERFHMPYEILQDLALAAPGRRLDEYGP
ncbi:hypothetical protein SAVCW2_52280 [Streptomyces avermitilis]|uniref:Uncharacterized protein n=1 Tax=Streptomyces avermitilis TaxID=33903 RepID=A0A4D4N1K2_STRAX|nr:hypothetical protein SAV31267_066020 [Streptomyces avermitilis]GDY86029.1 hypothetical protein SAVCW2_52280 [Streptomyces avermitilis]